MQKFSERLISLRQERDMTQNDLAKIVKKTRSTVSGYETENKEPGYELLCVLADFFGVTTDYMLGRDEDRTHADVVFRNDNAAFKRKYDTLPKELKATVASAFDAFYVMFSRAMSSGDSEELELYRDLIDRLQKDRGSIKRLVRDSGGNIAPIFPQMMEAQNSLKAAVSSYIDSLLQCDIAAAMKETK